MNKWPSIIQQWFYPATCLLCGDKGISPLDICEGCLTSMPFLSSHCPICGEPSDAAGLNETPCGQCLQTPPPYNQTRVQFHYEGITRYLIQQLKFRKNIAAARVLGTLFASHVAGINKPQVIIPVPLHASRYRERGFNQAEEIARIVAIELSVPIDTQSCQRNKNTPPQTELNAKQRRKNLQGVFSSEIRDIQHVAIFDDVITTGSTVTALSEALKKSGVERIEIWACARA